MRRFAKSLITISDLRTEIDPKIYGMWSVVCRLKEAELDGTYLSYG
jgi:hypothetical protein